MAGILSNDDPNLPLQTQTLDTATPINNAVTNMQHDQLVQGQIAMQPLERQELQTRIAAQQFQNMDAQSQAHIKGNVILGALIKPYLDSGDTEGAKTVLSRVTSDPLLGQNAQDSLDMLNNGKADQLHQQASGLVNFGAQMGIIHPDMKIVGAGETLVDATGKPVASASPFGGLESAGQPMPSTGAVAGAMNATPNTAIPAATGAASTAPPANSAAVGGGAQPPPSATPVTQPATTNQSSVSPPPTVQANVAPALASAASGPRNEEYLATLPANIQPIVKGLANYDFSMNQIPARNPQIKMAIMSAVKNYAPSYNENGYNTIKDFTVGKTSQNVKQIETALNTLAQAKDASDTLGGVNNAWIMNAPANYLSNVYNEAENNPDLTTYNNLAKNAADETSKAVAGAGNSAVSDRETRENNYRAGQSPDSRNAALTASVKDLMARLEPTVQQFNNGTTSNVRGIDLLSPKARASYDKLMGAPAPNTTVGPNQPNASSPAAGGWKYIGKVQQ